MQKKKIDSRKIIQKLERQKSDRQKITLYLSRQLYEDLRKKCKDVAPSQVIEELIKEFIEGLD